MNLFLAPENIPFGVALCLLIALVVIEIVGMFLSHSPSSWLDQFIPDNMDGPLGWLHIGRVPILVSLIVFLFGFASSGYLIQMASFSLFGAYLNELAVSLVALFGGLVLMRLVSNLIGNIIPRDESSVLDEESLTGRIGIVTLGTAKENYAAQVRVNDHQGRSYYLMVVPEDAGEEFTEGTSVIIVRKLGATYRAIRNPHIETL